MNRYAVTPRQPSRSAQTIPARRRPGTERRRTESESVSLFRKVLDLELKRGCADSAVIGGLDRFLERAGSDKALTALLKVAPPPGKAYRLLPPAERERWIKAVLAARPAPESSGRKAQPASRAATAAAAKSEQPADPLKSPVTVIRGVSGALQAKLAKLDVRNVRDLVYLFPNRHNDFGDIRPINELDVGEEQTCLVSVWNATVTRLGRRDGTQAVVGDSTGTMRVVWFNQTYLADQLKTNDRILLSGKVSLFNGQRTMESPEWERFRSADDLTHTGRLVPVYPLTQGLSQRVLRRVVKEAIDRFVNLVPEALPADLRERHALSGVVQALRQMHYPDSFAEYEQARRRIAFEELLCVQLAVLERRLAWQSGRAVALDTLEILDSYCATLPFVLTGAQKRVLGEVAADLATDRPMARLLQGDVGSGKTAVAGAAFGIAAVNGYQGALMAPTEILAEQHYRTLTTLLGGREFADRRPLRIELVTGSLRSAAKRAAIEAIAAGEVDVAVGTHALIQEGVAFKQLGLTVVDEQHRFGVGQRAALRERQDESAAKTPHLLVMSATPIPRTLALTFYGDLDVSVIDEMPPGRRPVKTLWVGPNERDDAYRFVREQVMQGRQSFVVCPLIEESAAVQTRAATQEYERLQRDVFPDLRLALLHGRVAAAEKDAVLGSFRRGESDVLVATTVIEVGIDIPNATVMVIEGADRFGLAQLHQLRGRVGRGAEQSFCLLLSDDPSATARERLRLLEENTDGFTLAEADLRLRGPGDYLGTRQSGLPEFHAADFSDASLIEMARQEAQSLLASDPGLRQPANAALAAAVAQAKRIVSGEVS